MSYGTVQAEKMTTESGYSLGAGNASSFKNRIINGAMVIDQRNAGASVSITNGATTYTLDRWAVFENGSMAFSAQRSTTAPAGFINSILITTTTGASAGSSDRSQLFQRIEGFNVFDLGWGTANAKTVTLSFWIRSSLTGQFGGSIQNNNQDRSYPFSFTISSANTFEYKSVTIPGDTTGTWLSDNSSGIQLLFDLGMGANLLGPADAWATADYRGATGDVKLSGTTNATLFLTGVQLEVGTVATSFDYRPYGTELALCQRYLVRLSDPTNQFTFYGVVCGSAGTDKYGAFSGFNMRTTPTITSGNLQVAGAATASVTSVNSYGGVVNGVIPFFVSFAASQPQGAYFVQNGASTSGFIQMSAEL